MSRISLFNMRKSVLLFSFSILMLGLMVPCASFATSINLNVSALDAKYDSGVLSGNLKITDAEGIGTTLNSGTSYVWNSTHTFLSSGTMNFTGSNFTMTGSLTTNGTTFTPFTVTGTYGVVTTNTAGEFKVSFANITYAGSGLEGYFGETFKKEGVFSFHQTTGSNIIDGGTVTFNTPVPIPAAGWLLGTGLISLVGLRRKFRK